ncbi:MAG: MgtC/SapB family protein [archaeon]
MVYLIENEFTIIMRVLLSIFLGIVIGLERQKRKTETHNYGAAGLRTHMLVCMGTTMIVATGVVLFPNDPIRLAASIMAGIGFIGAGTIMSAEKKSLGLTNAASVWVAAAIGIAVGFGLYITSILGAMLALIILELRRFESLE